MYPSPWRKGSYYKPGPNGFRGSYVNFKKPNSIPRYTGNGYQMVPRNSGMAAYGYARNYKTGNYKGKSITRPELKCLDNPVGNISTDDGFIAIGSTWQNINTWPAGGGSVTTALNIIAAGDDIMNRDGREVMLQSLYMNLTLDNGWDAYSDNTDQPSQSVRS